MKIRTKNLKGKALKYAVELSTLKMYHPNGRIDVLSPVAARNVKLNTTNIKADVETLSLIDKYLGDSVDIPKEFI